MNKTRSQSVPVSTVVIEDVALISRSLSTSTSQTPSLFTFTPPHQSTSTPLATSTLPRPSRKKKDNNNFPQMDEICKVNRREVDKDLSTQKKALLGSLFKITFINGKSMEDSCNFHKALGMITCIRDMGIYLKVCSHLFEANDVFPELCMA